MIWPIVKNHYSWHKAANLLYIDNPVGTGFSHYSNGTLWNYITDEEVAEQLTEFLLQFMKLFPYYVQNKKNKRPKIYLFGKFVSPPGPESHTIKGFRARLKGRPQVW